MFFWGFSWFRGFGCLGFALNPNPKPYALNTAVPLLAVVRGAVADLPSRLGVVIDHLIIREPLLLLHTL